MKELVVEIGVGGCDHGVSDGMACTSLIENDEPPRARDGRARTYA
jgi:hypothetical protein